MLSRKALSLLILVAPTCWANSYYKDSDWNIQMMTHVRQDVAWREENGNRYLEFRLAGGTPGPAYNDNISRHGAAFWERNEVHATERFGRNKPYSISFNFRILSGFKGQRETFFQIHSWNQDCKSAYPQIMLKFNDGYLQVDSLNKKKFHNVTKTDIKIDDIYNKWINVKMVARPAGADRVRYTFSGEIFDQDLTVVAHLYDCSNQWLKFGIYRPGSDQRVNEMSVIDFDKVVVQQ